MLSTLVHSILRLFRGSPNPEGVQRVLAYASAQGWRMLVVDSFSLSGDETVETAYAVRYYNRAGELIEAVLAADGDEFRVTKSVRVPPKVARGILDRKVAMDCRKCGTNIGSGQDPCPYCRTWRHELRIA